MADPTRRQVVDELRSWLGTPWMHGVGLKGYRTDCIQYLATTAKSLGWIPSGYQIPKYRRDYSLHNDYSLLKKLLSEVAYEITRDDLDVGDLIIFENGRSAGHAGMYIGFGTMIHAHISFGVMEAPMDSARIDSFWRFRNKTLSEVP